MEKLLLSFIIPCYGGEMLVKNTIEEVIQMVEKKSAYLYEIIAVNDCSPDNELKVLYDLASHNRNIKVIDFAKNFGKHSALMAGYEYATGNIIICLDDDGQCPLDCLWDLLAPLFGGYDVSIAKYGIKKESLFRNMGSILNDKMAQILLDKPKNIQLANFFAMKKFVVDEMLHYHHPYPYIDGLIFRTTKNIVNVTMNDRERAIGKSTYTMRKLVGQILNGFTAFSVKPLRIATVLGFLCATFGFIYGIYTIGFKFFSPDTVLGYSSLMSALLFIGGMIMIILGLIGEYIGRIYICLNNSPQYVIRNKVNINVKDINI